MSDAQNLTGMTDSNDSGAGGYVDADLRDVINDALAEDVELDEEQKLAQAYRKYYDDRTLEEWRMMFFDMQNKYHAKDMEWRDLRLEARHLARQIKVYMDLLETFQRSVATFAHTLNSCFAAARAKSTLQVVSVIRESFGIVKSIRYTPRADVQEIMNDLLGEDYELPF